MYVLFMEVHVLGLYHLRSRPVSFSSLELVDQLDTTVLVQYKYNSVPLLSNSRVASRITISPSQIFWPTPNSYKRGRLARETIRKTWFLDERKTLHITPNIHSIWRFNYVNIFQRDKTIRCQNESRTPLSFVATTLCCSLL
jgi:hypothetical protein